MVRPLVMRSIMRHATLRSVASQVHRPRLIAGPLSNGCHGHCARGFGTQAPGNGDIDNVIRQIRQGNVKPVDRPSSSELLLDVKEVAPTYGRSPRLVKAFSGDARALSKNYAFLFGYVETSPAYFVCSAQQLYTGNLFTAQR